MSNHWNNKQGKPILGPEDLHHLAINKQSTSELIELMHMKFGNDCFRKLLATPIEAFPDFIRDYLPEFTFTSTDHILTQIDLLKRTLKLLPNHRDVVTNSMRITVDRRKR